MYYRHIAKVNDNYDINELKMKIKIKKNLNQKQKVVKWGDKEEKVIGSHY